MGLLRKLLVAVTATLICGPVFAAPDQTMTITPSATSGNTILASDENTRNSNISTPYNAHTHNDITKTTNNSFTIGDGTSGSKSVLVDNSFSTSPAVRYDETSEAWQISNDGSNYYDVANMVTDISAGGILFSGENGTNTVSGTAVMANGELLIGNNSTAPVLANLTAGNGISITNGAGTISIASSTQSAIVDFTRTTGQSTANNVSYSGMGFQATALAIICTESSSTDRMSIGFVDASSDEASIFSSGASVAFGYDSSGLIRISDGTDAWNATFSGFTSDGFELDWTKTSSGKNVNCSALGVR